MSTFRTLRPLVVDATQCEHAKTIATDTGFCNVSKGDWIVKGENGETYVVDDAFFQRTFTPLQTYPWELPRRRPPLRLLISHKDLTDFHSKRLPGVVAENIDHAYEDAVDGRFFVRVQARDERQLFLLARAICRPALGESIVLQSQSTTQ